MTDRPTDSVSERVYALIFNGVTRAASESDGFDSWLPLTERERFAEAVFAELRAGNIEFRLGSLALLADLVEAEGRLVARTYEGPTGEHSACMWGETCKVFPGLRHEFARPAENTEAS